jgi:SAM-dependent methyltransferase
MTRRLNLPDSASVARPGEGGKLCAPSAERNAGPICDLVERYGPPRGRALELASGTGQHAVALAHRLPDLDWQPTEIDEDRRASIRAWAAEAGLPNLRDPVALDAATPGWAAAQGPADLILLVNLLHLIPEAEARTIVAEAGRALAPGGTFILYGPFMRGGELTSEGDRTFHASLKAQDPAIGYKDDFDVADWLHAAGLSLTALVEMPANNLAFVARR